MTRVCAICGATLGSRCRKFCSYKCAQVSRHNEHTCECVCVICNKKYTEYAYRINEGRGKFCSLKCYWKSLRGHSQSAETQIKRGNSLREFYKTHTKQGQSHEQAKRTIRKVMSSLPFWIYVATKSEETRRKLSASRMGHTVSEETRQKISKTLTGRPLSKEARNKIRQIFAWTNPEKVMLKLLFEVGLVSSQIEDHVNITLTNGFTQNVDFALKSHNILIEVDGAYYHNFPYGKPRDLKFKREAEQDGYYVLRVWDTELLKNRGEVKKQIENLIFKSMMEKKINGSPATKHRGHQANRGWERGMDMLDGVVSLEGQTSTRTQVIGHTLTSPRAIGDMNGR